MLKQIRQFHSSLATKILYGLIAASFLIWGVGTFGDATVDVVAEVQGVRITRTDVDREAALLQRRYEQLLKGVSLPRLPDLQAQALETLIEAALVRHEIRRLGLDVTEDELVDAITSIPELQENGRFSRDLLERVLRLNRDRGEFEEQMRRGLREQRLRNLITDGVEVTDAEVAELYQLDREKLSLVFVRVRAADLAKTAPVTDEDLERERTAHEERYRTPTTVRARYVVYREDEFAPVAAPTDEQVRAYYDLHLADRFTDVEEVRARHILIAVAPAADDAAKAKARARAEDLSKQIRAGADFAALAKKHSEDPGSAAKDGDLGFFPRGRMVPPFEVAAFALEAGQVSDIVETPFGFHIIKVEERKPGGPKPFEAVQAQIVQELTSERALDLARGQADADRRAVVRGKSLAEAVGDRKLEETPPFAADADVPGVGRVKAFTDAAFDLDDGNVSDLIETDDAIYMLAPFDRKEPVLPELADIRAEVEPNARLAAGERLAKEKAQALLARAKEIGLEQAAAERALLVDETGGFERRTGTIPTLGPVADLQSDLSSLSPEAPLAPRVYSAGGDAVVAALQSRTPADMSEFDPVKKDLRDTLLAQRRQSTLQSFMLHLKEAAVREGALSIRAEEPGRG